MCPTAAVSVVPERERPELDAGLLLDEETPYSGLEASRHLPLLLLLAGWELAARCGWQESFTCGGALSWCQPPGPTHLPRHMHNIWNITSRIGNLTLPLSTIHALQLFSEMAASPGTELVSPASPPTTSSQTSHLKAYPYLFVRETDQVED